MSQSELLFSVDKHGALMPPFNYKYSIALVIKSWHEGSVFIYREEQLSLVHMVCFSF